MSTREFFVKRWEQEQPAFAKVLRAVPEGQLAYRPHERCTPAGALAWQLVEEQKQLIDMVQTGEVTFALTPHPAAASDIVSEWEKATEKLRAAFNAADDAKWAGKAKLVMGEGAEWADTLENMCWGYLFDMVHHRGQLSAYLRPMGGKVPSIYGPSADDSGSQYLAARILAAPVEWPSEDHLYWPDLDIDLSIRSIEHPEEFPLVFQAEK